MSYSRVMSAVLCGLEVIPVQVEADLSNGLPMFHMVGYLSAEVKEAGERVRTAISNSGFSLLPKKTVINLSPGNIRKRGTSFDLSIALAILASAGEVVKEGLEGVMAVGELGLDGSIRGVNGVLPIAAEAKKQQVRCLIVPLENEAEARLVEGLSILGIGSLRELCEVMRKDSGQIGTKGKFQIQTEETEEEKIDFSDIRGQEAAKRATEIAVAGHHNLLIIGPPGGGKSMLARRIPGILPSMTYEESIQITKIYSIAGLVKKQNPLITKRPFREVHQTATMASLLGGGVMPRPGEITLASGGVLFLDEIAEFRRGVLESLRQPLEERVVRISRNQGTFEFPADIMLVAAMNPCPCGYYPDYNRCGCTHYEVQQYLRKISQPFLGRMDICIEVPGVEYGDLSCAGDGEVSAQIRKRVERARRRQLERYKESGILFNSAIPASEFNRYCSLGKEEERMMAQAFDRLSLTVRTYHKILKVARTIADLDGEERIQKKHLQEALIYRSIDKKYWGNV